MRSGGPLHHAQKSFLGQPSEVGGPENLEQPQAVTSVPHPSGLPRLPLHPMGTVLSRLLMSKAFSDRDKLPVFPPKNSCASSGLCGRPIDS